MANENQTETVETVETEQNEAENQSTERAEISKAEFDRMAAALKQANKEAAARRKRL